MFVTWTSLSDAGTGSVTFWKQESYQKQVALANKSEIVHTGRDSPNRTNYVYRGEMTDLQTDTYYCKTPF